MITHGTVIEKNGSVSRIKIGSSDCQSCGKCGKYRNKVISAIDETNSLVGDNVELEIYDNQFNLSVLVFYVLPLLAFILGILLGYYIISPLFSENLIDSITVLCGIIFTVICYLILRIFKNKFDSKLAARVIKIE